MSVLAKIIPSAKKEYEKPTTTVLGFKNKDGGYVIEEYMVPAWVLEKHCVKVNTTEPEIFAIVQNMVTKRIREILEI